MMMRARQFSQHGDKENNGLRAAQVDTAQGDGDHDDVHNDHDHEVP